jgi:tetratricopeptide (TPR) repeat protein
MVMKMINKGLILICLLAFASVTLAAIKEIPSVDLSKSNKFVVKKHSEIIKDFNQAKSSLSGVKLGTAYGELGMFYQAHELVAAAIVSYENAIELSAFDHRWPYLLGFLKALEGNYKESNAAYEATLKINNEYLPAIIRWGANELEQGNFDNAKKLFERVLKVAPDFSRALAGLGTINMQEGNIDDAVKYFEKVLVLQPYASQVNYLLSQAYNAKGDLEKANYYISKKGQQPVEMFDKVLQEMHLKSVNPTYYAHAAINAFMSKDIGLAEKLALKSIEMDPEDINPNYTLINVYIATNRYKEAQVLTKELINKQPKNERLYYILGMVEEKSQNISEAIKAYNAALELSPNNKTVVIALANLYMTEKNFKLALSMFRKSQSQDQENPYPIYAEALILSYLNLCDRSIEKFQQAISKQPENFTYLTGFVKTVAVCEVSDASLKSDALNAARNMYAILPSIKITQALAMIEAAVGNNKDAIDYQAQAIFFAVSQKHSLDYIERLKSELKIYKKGEKAKVSFYEYEITPDTSI